MRSVLTVRHLHKRQFDRRQHQPISDTLQLFAEGKQVHSQNDSSILCRPAPRSDTRAINRTLREQPEPAGIKGAAVANHAIRDRRCWHIARDR